VVITVAMLKPLSAAAERRRLGKLAMRIGALAYVRDAPLFDAKQEVRGAARVSHASARMRMWRGSPPCANPPMKTSTSRLTPSSTPCVVVRDKPYRAPCTSSAPCQPPSLIARAW
jgi:hypothetical protein